MNYHRLAHPILRKRSDHISAVGPLENSLRVSGWTGSESAVMRDFREGSRIHYPFTTGLEMATAILKHVDRNERSVKMLGVCRVMKPYVEVHSANKSPCETPFRARANRSFRNASTSICLIRSPLHPQNAARNACVAHSPGFKCILAISSPRAISSTPSRFLRVDCPIPRHPHDPESPRRSLDAWMDRSVPQTHRQMIKRWPEIRFTSSRSTVQC